MARVRVRALAHPLIKLALSFDILRPHACVRMCVLRERLCECAGKRGQADACLRMQQPPRGCRRGSLCVVAVMGQLLPGSACRRHQPLCRDGSGPGLHSGDRVNAHVAERKLPLGRRGRVTHVSRREGSESGGGRLRPARDVVCKCVESPSRSSLQVAERRSEWGVATVWSTNPRLGVAERLDVRVESDWWAGDGARTLGWVWGEAVGQLRG